MMITMESRVDGLNKILEERKASFYIQYTTTWKNNTELEGYVLRSYESSCSPTLYQGDWFLKPDMEVIKYLEEMYQQHAVQIDISSILDKDYVLSHILPRLVSASNIYEMENRKVTYVPYLDMAVLFYIPIDAGNVDDGQASIQVSDQLLNSVDLTAEQILQAALLNIEDTVEVKSMADILFGEMGLDAEELGDMQLPMWVVTNQSKINGAASILSKNTLKELSDKLGGQIAVLPSSVHECIVVPYEGEDELQTYVQMVQSINETEVRTEDKLTDSVYIYVDGELTNVA